MSRTLPWQEPLAFCEAIDDACWCLLYSGSRFAHTGGRSLLGVGLEEAVEGEGLDALPPLGAGAAYEGAWFGYVGYEAADVGAALPPVSPAPVAVPRVLWLRFATVVEFDHGAERIHVHGRPFAPRGGAAGAMPPPPAVTALASAMSTPAYREKVEALRAAIAEGEVYQANLTRKFYGRFDHAPGGFALFRRMMAIAPSPYAAFVRYGDLSILSASMERFLTVSPGGYVETRPIKGSAPRGHSAAEDAAIREALAQSAKNRAENLMIVDLMRNDLARVCVPGSVAVERLFEVTTYPTVHHMSSTVGGRLQPGRTAWDALAACFPPGSMTGAPKIAAMRRCAMLEGVERGVYSGCLGWVGGDGSADLSVVIRTLVIRGDCFEFQAGGAILWESDAEEELHETLTKARGMAATLGIPLETLAKL